MVCCGFLFDLILVRVDVPGVQIENYKLLFASVVFNKVRLRITPSRINVVEFKPNRSFDFDMPPQKLREDLATNPLQIVVYYDARPIGMANIPFQKSVLDRIQKNMGVVTHIDDSPLFCCEDEGERIGVLEYVYRLQCKCQESSEDYCQCCQFPYNDLKSRCNTKKINPEDVLFVIAEKPNNCDVCAIMDTQSRCNKADEQFDLTPYRQWNGKIMDDSKAVNTCYNADCCQLKKNTDPYKCFYELMCSEAKIKSRSKRKRSSRMAKNSSVCLKNDPYYSHYTPSTSTRCKCSTNILSRSKKAKSSSTCHNDLMKHRSRSFHNGGGGMHRSGNTARSCTTCFDFGLNQAPTVKSCLTCNVGAKEYCSKFKNRFDANANSIEGAIIKCSNGCVLDPTKRYGLSFTGCKCSKCQKRASCGLAKCFECFAPYYNHSTQSNRKKKSHSRSSCTAKCSESLYNVGKIKRRSSEKVFKNEQVYLICGPSTVDPSKRFRDIKTPSSKSKFCATASASLKYPKEDKVFLLPCENITKMKFPRKHKKTGAVPNAMTDFCFNFSNDILKFDVSNTCSKYRNNTMNLLQTAIPKDDFGKTTQSQPSCSQSPKKDKKKRKLFCDDELIAEYRRGLRKKTKKALEKYCDYEGKAALSLPSTRARNTEREKLTTVNGMTVDDIMKEFLKDDQ